MREWAFTIVACIIFPVFIPVLVFMIGYLAINSAFALKEDTVPKEEDE